MRMLTTGSPDWEPTYLGIGAQIADQNDLVDAARHDASPHSCDQELVFPRKLEQKWTE
jgi:hypothetical protein